MNSYRMFRYGVWLPRGISVDIPIPHASVFGATLGPQLEVLTAAWRCSSAAGIHGQVGVGGPKGEIVWVYSIYNKCVLYHIHNQYYDYHYILLLIITFIIINNLLLL